MKIPKENAQDKVLSGIKAIVNIIPLGGSVVEIFNAVITPPIEKRRQKWMQEVVALLKSLESKQSGSVDSLSNDEEFLSLLLSTSMNAYKTHLEEKHRMFKNILQKSIANEQLLFDIKQIFVNFVDELSISHIRILKFISENVEDIKIYNEFVEIYNVWKSNKFFSMNIDLITFRYMLKDLESKGLIIISSDMQEIANQVYESSNLVVDEKKDNGLPFISVSKLGYSFLSYVENE